jgi:hypothetical protein
MSEPNAYHVNVSINADPLDIPVWGAAAIGQVIGRDRRGTYHLIHTGAIDVSKVGALLVSTRRRLLKSLGVTK